MPYDNLSRFVTGIAWLDAALEEWATGIERANHWTVKAPLKMVSTDAGMTLSLQGSDRKCVKLTSSNGDGSYQAADVYASTGGGWVLVPGGWTGKVWEANRNSTVSLTATAYVEVRYCRGADEWRFQAGSC